MQSSQPHWHLGSVTHTLKGNSIMAVSTPWVQKAGNKIHLLDIRRIHTTISSYSLCKDVCMWVVKTMTLKQKQHWVRGEEELCLCHVPQTFWTLDAKSIYPIWWKSLKQKTQIFLYCLILQLASNYVGDEMPLSSVLFSTFPSFTLLLTSYKCYSCYTQ